jgi:hypothetical protein
MATYGRRAILGAGCLIAAMATGCNMMALPFFLIPSLSDEKPKCDLVSKDKDKEVKVVILASMGLETHPDLVRFDTDLSRLLAHTLQEAYKARKEKVTIVSNSRVEKYKDDHPNWQALSDIEIGKHFHADYVIVLEIGSLSIYEKGSSNTLYQGRAGISVKVVDLNANDDNRVKFEEEYRCEFPRGGRPVPAGDNDLAQFKRRFLNVAARELSWNFVAHPFDDETSMADR